MKPDGLEAGTSAGVPYVRFVCPVCRHTSEWHTDIRQAQADSDRHWAVEHREDVCA